MTLALTSPGRWLAAPRPSLFAAPLVALLHRRHSARSQLRGPTPLRVYPPPSAPSDLYGVQGFSASSPSAAACGGAAASRPSPAPEGSPLDIRIGGRLRLMQQQFRVHGRDFRLVTPEDVDAVIDYNIEQGKYVSTAAVGSLVLAAYRGTQGAEAPRRCTLCAPRAAQLDTYAKKSLSHRALVRCCSQARRMATLTGRACGRRRSRLRSRCVRVRPHV